MSVKNFAFLKLETSKAYRSLEFESKANHQGIHKKPFEILSLIYTKNNLVGKV